MRRVPDYAALHPGYGTTGLLMCARGEELGDGGEPEVGADGCRRCDTEEEQQQQQQRRHQGVATDTGEADDEAGCGAGDDEHQVHLFFWRIDTFGVMAIAPFSVD